MENYQNIASLYIVSKINKKNIYFILDKSE